MAMAGVEADNADVIQRYWREWAEWRGQQNTDPLQYANAADYSERQHFCEATLRYLGAGRGTLAHVVSRGAGGSDEPWNLLKLCDEAHLEVQHRHGWDEFLQRYPHLKGVVERARRLHAEGR